MTGLPRAIIKKYGVTKKAWAVFRGRKMKRSTSKRRVSHARTRKRSISMARRRYYGRRRRSSRLGGLGGVKNLVGKAAIGLGTGALLGMVAPSFAGNSLARGAAAYFVGGPVAGIAAVALTGGLGNILGGGSSGNMNW